jgi:hypothetical protein
VTTRSGTALADRAVRRLGLPRDFEYSDYPPVTIATKKKILGLSTAKLYGVAVRRTSNSIPARHAGRSRRRAALVEG